jgi:hypothetical protein
VNTLDALLADAPTVVVAPERRLSFEVRRAGLRWAEAVAGVVRDPSTAPADLRRVAEILHSEMASGLASVVAQYNPGLAESLDRSQWMRAAAVALPALEAVAAHPNTPPDLLAKVAPFAPAAFCRNPVAPLLALEGPELAGRFGAEGACRLLRRADLPASLTALFASGSAPGLPPYVADDAREHVTLAPELGLDEWQGAVRSRWERHAAEAGGAAQEAYTELALLGLAPPWAAGPEYNVGAGTAALRRLAGPGLCAGAEEQPLPPFSHLVAALNPALPRAERKRRLNALGVEPVRLRWQAEYVRRKLRWRFGRPLRTADDVLGLVRCAALQWGPFAWEGMQPGDVPLCRFVRLMERTDPPQYSSERLWFIRLGWTLGVRPAWGHRWTRAVRARLEAYAEDGNRLIRAAARARLADPDLRFVL